MLRYKKGGITVFKILQLNEKEIKIIKSHFKTSNNVERGDYIEM